MNIKQNSNPYDTPYWIYIIISMFFVISLLCFKHFYPNLYNTADLQGFTYGGEFLIVFLLYKSFEQKRIKKKR